jgi:hypothetical protein
MTMKKTMLVATFLYILFLFFNDFYGWEEQSKFLGLIFSDPLSIHLSDLVGFGHIQSWQLGVGGGYYSRESLAFSVAPESGTVGILFGWSALLVIGAYRRVLSFLSRHDPRPNNFPKNEERELALWTP